MTHLPQTAESVSAGHPDKICDHISDHILDACLIEDPQSKVAIETMAGHGNAFLLGEVTTNANVDFVKKANEVLQDFGYSGYHIESHIVAQSPEISKHVSNGGAGDQGVMVGYACNETPEMLPKEFSIARNLSRLMGTLDGKTQVTIEKGEIRRLVTSLGGDYPKELIEAVIALGISEGDPRWIKNQYKTTGLDSDVGLTGRKIVVDAYGPRVPVGGGAFSGKDPSKVDRSGAYMARKVAVDILKKNNAQEVRVKLAYSIGLSEELMATAEIIHADGKMEIIEHVKEYDFSPNAIIALLGLEKIIYQQTSRFGHFGNDFNWDR